jgi:hypothetical protein
MTNQNIDPSRQADKQSAIEKVVNFINPLKRTGQNINLATGGVSLGRESKKTSEIISSLGEQSRNLATQAKSETDPIKKQQLLNQSRVISNKINDLGAGIEKSTANYMQKGGVKEEHLSQSRGEFAARRAGSQMLEQAAFLAPFTGGAVAATQGVRALTGVRGALTRVGFNALKGSTIGGMTAAGTSLIDGDSVEEMIIDTIQGQIIGGVIAGGLSAAGEIVKPVLKSGQTLINRSFLREKPKDVKLQEAIDEENIIRTGKNQLIENVKNMFRNKKLNPQNSKVAVANEAQRNLNQTEKVINKTANNSNITIERDVLLEPAKQTLDKYKNSSPSKAQAMENWIKAMEKNHPKIMSLKDTLKWKRDLDWAQAKANFSQESLSDIGAVEAVGQMATANKARAVMGEVTPEVAELLKDESTYIQLIHLMDNQIKKGLSAPSRTPLGVPGKIMDMTVGTAPVATRVNVAASKTSDALQSRGAELLKNIGIMRATQ